MTMIIRAATQADADGVWAIIEPMIRAGETYALDRDMSREQALAYWFSPGHAVFVAEEDGQLLGTYYMRANQRGGGAHVANCGYVVAPDAGGRGIARALAEHSLEEAPRRGFRAMQYNFVISSNERAVGLWHRLGFETLCRLPQAFDHPRLGLVDALLMFRTL